MAETSPAPLVSIVTPVYNGEEFLAPCIESVLAQTYANWEYLIIDNQSKDRSLEIAREYARRDSRVRVLTTPSFYQRGIDSWNNALRQMSPAAKYCKIVHADDWIFPECVEKMVRVAEAHPSVGIVGSYRLCNRTLDCDGLPYPSPVVSGVEVCRGYLLGQLFVFGSPTTTLLRSDLVRARENFYLLYTDTESYEYLTDMEVCLYALQNSDFGFVHEVLSFTRLHETSITSELWRTGQTHTIPEFLHMLRHYGPVFLTPEECEARASSLLRELHRAMALDMVLGHRQLVAKQQTQLERLGRPIGTSRLWWIAATLGAKFLLRPSVQALRLLKARFFPAVKPGPEKETRQSEAPPSGKAAATSSVES
jgi:glycosyltransferase involved in cell wall biosynthesis